MVEALFVHHVILLGLYVLTRKNAPQPDTDAMLLGLFFIIWFAALTGTLGQ